MTAREIISSDIVYGTKMAMSYITLESCYRSGYDYGMNAPDMRYYKVRVFGYTEEQNRAFSNGMKAAHYVIDCWRNDKRKRDSEDFPR